MTPLRCTQCKKSASNGERKDALFTIHVELKEGRTLKIEQRSIVEALDNVELRGLFDE